MRLCADRGVFVEKAFDSAGAGVFGVASVIGKDDEGGRLLDTVGDCQIGIFVCQECLIGESGLIQIADGDAAVGAGGGFEQDRLAGTGGCGGSGGFCSRSGGFCRGFGAGIFAGQPGGDSPSGRGPLWVRWEISGL